MRLNDEQRQAADKVAKAFMEAFGKHSNDVLDYEMPTPKLNRVENTFAQLCLINVIDRLYRGGMEREYLTELEGIEEYDSIW